MIWGTTIGVLDSRSVDYSPNDALEARAWRPHRRFRG